MEYLIAILIAYAYLAFSFQTIAKKTGTDNALNAWIPVLNLFLIAKIAQKPNWLGLLLLVPIVNFAVAIFLVIEIVKIMQKPAWLGMLLIFPGIGLIVPGYIAFSSGTAPVSKNIGNLIIGMILSSIVVAIGVFYMLTLKPIQETIKSNEAYSLKEIEKLDGEGKKTPKSNMINNLKTFHENIRKARVSSLDVLNQLDGPIEMKFPEVEFSNITAFKTKMNVYVSALKLFYTEAIMNKPIGSDDRFSGNAIKFDDDAFEQLKENLDSEANCRLALKKCLIVTELLNALKASIDTLNIMANDADPKSYLARFKTEKPICGIVKLDFPGLKGDALTKERDAKSLAGVDGSRFYSTLPFSFELAIEPELYSLFYREISIPKKVDIVKRDLNITVDEEAEEEEIVKKELALFESIFNNEENSNELDLSFSNAVRQRYGLHFDFLYSNSKMAKLEEDIDKQLLTDKEARKLYIEHFGKMIGNDPTKPLPPKGEDPKDHVGRWSKCFEVQEKLSGSLTSGLTIKPSYLVAEVGGAAIDFTLEALIANILYEERVKAGTLKATTTEDEE